VVRADVGLALDDVEAGAPDPLFAQGASKRVRVYERTAGRVDEDGMPLHLSQKLLVYDVPRDFSTGREDEQDVTFARELVRVDAADGAQAVFGGERELERFVAG
jgi:hypothetical protein